MRYNVNDVCFLFPVYGLKPQNLTFKYSICFPMILTHLELVAFGGSSHQKQQSIYKLPHREYS